MSIVWFFPSILVDALVHDGRLAEHAGGLLEGGCGNEVVGRRRGLGDAQQQGDVAGFTFGRPTHVSAAHDR